MFGTLDTDRKVAEYGDQTDSDCQKYECNITFNWLYLD